MDPQSDLSNAQVLINADTDGGDVGWYVDNFSVSDTAVREPSTFVQTALALLCLGFVALWKKNCRSLNSAAV